jgi:hypothetical protein
MFFFVSDVAFIQYDKFDSILDYNETQVPPAFRRKGIAQILAKVNGIFVVPYLRLSLYRSNLCKNECELSLLENKILFQDTVSVFVS